MKNDFHIQFKDVDVNILLSFIAEGLIMFDEEGHITTLNPHASLLLDYTTDELIGKKFDEIITLYIDDCKIEESNGVVSKVSQGEVFTVPDNKTLYFESRGKNRFPVFTSAKPMQFSRGDDLIKGGVLVFRDITTEKELERYKENTAKTLSELTPVLQKTATGDFSYRPTFPKEENEFTELIVGLSLMLDDLRELDHNREKNEQEKLNALEEKRILTESYSKELEQEVDRKTNELSNAKKHIETIIENLTNGLVEYDRQGRIIRLNKVAEDMLGVKKSYIIGEQINERDADTVPFQSIVAVTYLENSEGVKKISRDVSGIDADIYELTIKYPIERNVQIATVPVVSVGNEEGGGVLKIIRDVTRERLISRSKSEFISIAAHQLRTPLSGVKWALNLLLNGEFGKLEPEQKKMVDETVAANEKMIVLVNDLLNVARIEDGRFGYEFNKDDFCVLTKQITKMSQPYAKDKGIELTFENKASCPFEFVFDKNKISVAVQNLVDNAIKYTPKGKSIKIVLSSDDKSAQLEVIDTGVGVPEHQIGRLFTKFFRAENVVSLPVSGSGLGLFITRNIIVRHGGDIKVYSKENEGTTFTFFLPLDETMIPAKDDVAASLYLQ